MNRNFAWDKQRRGKQPGTAELAADREALRTHDRFGISSWPQMIVFDPRDHRVLATPPRSLAGVEAAFTRAVKAGPRPAAAGKRIASAAAEARRLHSAGKKREAIRRAEAMASKRDHFLGWLEARALLRDWAGGKQRKLEERLADPDPMVRVIVLEEIYLKLPAGGKARSRQAKLPQEERILELLVDDREDIVVRLRALWCLGEARPRRVAEHAAKLLEVSNDPFRYRVLQALGDAPDPQLSRVLVKLFKQAGGAVPSKNPNVLRINTARVLAKVGDASAVAALAEVARAADDRNGLTGVVVEALGAIGSRARPAVCREVVAILLESFPPPLADPRAKRRRLALVKKIAAALAVASGRKRLPAPPAVWSEQDRSAYLRSLRRAVGAR